MATGGSWLDEMGQQLRGVLDALWGEVKQHGLLPMLEPVPPFNRPGFLSPAIALGGVLGVMLLSGMALTAFGSLVVTLLALYLLLVEVFGVSVELHPFGR
jgi:hypothetical protein